MRAEHFNDYVDIPEIVPGVFVDPGNGVYIVDDEGEVACWVDSEWSDPDAVTATINAVILATKKGASAVRQNIIDNGQTLLNLVLETGNVVGDE